MPFLQRHRLWILPLLGLGAVWGVWNSVDSISNPPKPSPLPSPVGATKTPAAAPSPSAPIALPTPAPPADKSLPPSMTTWGNPRALEAPPSALCQRDSLLQESAKPLQLRLLQPTEPPILHAALLPPGVFFEPNRRKTSPGLAPSSSLAMPALDFIIERPGPPPQREAWFDGTPFREGDKPQAGYTITKITSNGVWLHGPKGNTFIATFVRADEPQASSCKPPTESPATPETPVPPAPTQPLPAEAQ